jgi:hypothetical protein
MVSVNDILLFHGEKPAPVLTRTRSWLCNLGNRIRPFSGYLGRLARVVSVPIYHGRYRYSQSIPRGQHVVCCFYRLV